MAKRAPSHHEDLVCLFFVYFARFEYALKQEGMVKGNESRAAADWDAYAKRIAHVFEDSASTPIDVSVRYLRSHPPRKQVVLKGKLAFAEAKQTLRESDSHYIFRLIRMVRNNLFHGGKFSEPGGPIAQTPHDRNLLSHALKVLKECGNKDPTLRRWLKASP